MLAGKCLADTHASAECTIGAYVIFLKDSRARSRHYIDPLFRLPKPPELVPVPKGQVLEAIEKCDTGDSGNMFLLRAIADMSQDRDIQTAAQKAILLRMGQAMVGIPPRQD